MSNTISTIGSLPAIQSSENSFFQYLREIQKFPLLTAEEEYKYGVRYQEEGDQEAAQILVQSHLRLVVKIATTFRNYGMPIVDLISEGNIGLMKAVKKFQPTKGYRFSTYAMWWIKAYIQEYILKSWSLVKIGTTVAQKKLFFNLRKIKNKLQAAESGNLLPEEVETISRDLNVPKYEVLDMNARMQHSDTSLNQVIGDDSDLEMIDVLESADANQEDLVIIGQEKSHQEDVLESAMSKLKDREKEILIARKLSEKPVTLEELSKIHKVSKERVRQIEAAAMDKIKKEILCSQAS